MKSCLNPAATPGEPHSSASLRPTSPLLPNNREQPTNPHRVTLVSTPGPPTSSPMKEPPTPRPPNSREYQKYHRHKGQNTGRTLSPPPPANLTAKKTKARTRWTPVKDSKVHPPTPTWRTSPPQTKENPYTPGQKFQESNSIQHPKMPQNSTGELPPPPPDLGSPPCDTPPHSNKPRD
ncbi:hypothetical protein E4T56_gene3610 [Termitomyces sp. T112]|nr:hypothetical protein E4T56_gene3610 [Termitomyces sp. T112]